MFAPIETQLIHAARRVSKHRQFDEHGRHIPGKCRFNRKQSGLRKLMRAMRRGTLDAEHQRDIRLAEGAGRDRRFVYMSAGAKRRGLQILQRLSVE